MQRFHSFFATAALVVISAAAYAQAVLIPGITAVGTSAAPVTVSVTLPNGGTIASVNVLGQGIPNVDFSATPGGTCAPSASFLTGQSCTATIVFAPKFPGPRSGAIVLLDAANNTIGSQLLAGSATGAVGVFVPGIISTVAGDASWVYAGDGQPATKSPIFLPFGIAVDAKGNLFIADSSNNRIRRVDATSGIMTTVAGNGIVGSTGDGGPATAASINNPTSIALDPAGNLFIADSGNQVIRRVDAFTGIIATFAGKLTQHGYTGDGGPATAATLKTPNGISFDQNGNLYIADTGNNVIRIVAAANGTIATIAGNGSAGFSGDGGPATAAQLSAPWSATPIPSTTPGPIAFYFADQNNDRIRKVDTSGNISTAVGTSAGYSGDNGPASQAQLLEPASVLIDVAGDLYIADSGNNVVRRVATTTGTITTYAGSTAESFFGDSGPADKAGLYGPYAFALDTRGNLYIADVFHNRIRQVTADTAILYYPSIRVGSISAPLTQTLENDGNAPLIISQFNPVLNSQIDPTTTTCSQSTPLAILAQCVIGVDFAPTTTGSPVTGELDVDSNAGNSPNIINLSGNVLAVNPTTITLTSNINPSATGSPVVFTAKVSNKTTPAPTGSVNLLDGTNSIATATLDATGAASFTVTTLTAGSHNMTAVYAGDPQNAAATSAVLVQVVIDQQPTTTTLTASVPSALAGAPVTLTATVNAAATTTAIGNIAGTVNFLQGTTILGAASLNAATATSTAATATITLTTLPVGSDSITAAYTGSILFGASTSPAIPETITQAATQVTLTSSENPALLEDNVVFSITVANAAGSVAPTGAVTLTDGATTLATLPISPTGTASYTDQAPAVGTHIIVATYNGDADHTPAASQPLNQTVTLRPSTTSFSATPTSLSFGQQVTLFSLVQASGSRAATGTVTWVAGSTTLGKTTINAGGLASFSATPPQGIFSVVAQYSGDALYAPSVSAPITITVGPTIEFIIALNPTSLTIPSGDHASIAITITPATTFTDTLAMGCAGLPIDATCTFSRSQVPVSGGGIQTLSVIVDTGNPLGAGAAAQLRTTSSLTQLAALPFGALFAIALATNRRRLYKLRPRLALFTLLLTLGLTAATLTGCGSSLNIAKTPPGSYSFQVVASGNTTLVTQTKQIALTVTK